MIDLSTSTSSLDTLSTIFIYDNIQNANANSILNCTIQDNFASGITTKFSNGLTFNNNIIFNTAYRGINIGFGSQKIELKQNYVVQNYAINDSEEDEIILSANIFSIYSIKDIEIQSNIASSCIDSYCYIVHSQDCDDESDYVFLDNTAYSGKYGLYPYTSQDCLRIEEFTGFMLEYGIVSYQ
mmetsp:Transcript_16407/g.14090  ORF Transcript_16407/g.14090 Transcript_16407/m.14090 type:complete len:183 (+) Transcript_16407:547-1095(+)